MTQELTPIERLKQKKKQLDEKIKRLESAEKNRERKRETRRKILVGAFYLDQARESGEFDTLVQKMDIYLSRSSDRELFCLEPKASDEKENTSGS